MERICDQVQKFRATQEEIHRLSLEGYMKGAAPRSWYRPIEVKQVETSVPGISQWVHGDFLSPWDEGIQFLQEDTVQDMVTGQERPAYDWEEIQRQRKIHRKQHDTPHLWAPNLLENSKQRYDSPVPSLVFGSF